MTKPAHTGLSPEASATLQQRAKDLARPLEEETAATTLELLTFARGGSTYAMSASDAVAVVPFGEPTPVPGTPPAVRGVVNHRGRILAVIDVERLLSPAQPEGPGPELGIVVATDAISFVLLADDVPELVAVEEHEIAPAVDGAEGPVHGVTGTMAAVLDLSALARDPRIAVDDELE